MIWFFWILLGAIVGSVTTWFVNHVTTYLNARDFGPVPVKPFFSKKWYWILTDHDYDEFIKLRQKKSKS